MANAAAMHGRNRRVRNGLIPRNFVPILAGESHLGLFSPNSDETVTHIDVMNSTPIQSKFQTICDVFRIFGLRRPKRRRGTDSSASCLPLSWIFTLHAAVDTTPHTHPHSYCRAVEYPAQEPGRHHHAA